MNSTLKSLVFWLVLIVVGALVWNFSSNFQRKETSVSFSEFVSWVDAGQVDTVTITGSEITGTTKGKEFFRTFAPLQYEGLANRLIEKRVVVNAKEPAASPWAALLLSWAPILLVIGFGSSSALAAADGSIPRCAAAVAPASSTSRPARA